MFIYRYDCICGYVPGAEKILYRMRDYRIGWLDDVQVCVCILFGCSCFLYRTVCAVLVARMLTVRLKCPITIFMISGIITLVPGAGIYFTAYYLVTNQFANGCCERDRSNKSGFWNCAWNCLHCICSERSVPERILG